METEAIAHATIGAAIDVHRVLGPGLLESAYEKCLLYELHTRGMSADRQVPIPVQYKGVTIDCGYRIDLLVEGKVVVEVKSVDRLIAVHFAQVLTYLRLADLYLGLLLNFNVPSMRLGVRRLVQGPPR